MDLSEQKAKCLLEWVSHVLPEEKDIDNVNWVLIMKLTDVANDSELLAYTGKDHIANSVLKVLSEFYSVDLSDVLSINRDTWNLPPFSQFCLVLLVLTMGLKLKSKVFMSAAFKLPTDMHFSIVQMTQRLIEDCPITISSFCGLCVDSCNQPKTPIRQSRADRFPLTCPADVTCTPMPFGCKNKSFNNLDVASQINTYSFEKLGSDITMTNLSTNFNSKNKILDCIGSDQERSDITFSSVVDSPLYSLKSILESPQLVPKTQYLSKLDELRDLSAKLSEIQHLNDENLCEINRLNTELQISELQRKEGEVKLKIRDKELNELRDELTYEIEMRSKHEKNSRRVDYLQERLNDANDKLKFLNQIQGEKQTLIRENGELRSNLKVLNDIRSRLVPQQQLERQFLRLKATAHIANKQLYELICEREKCLANSEAEIRAKSNSEIRNHPHCLDSPILYNSAARDQSPVSSLSATSHETENLASVVMTNTYLQDIEMALQKYKTDFVVLRRKYVCQRFKSLVMKALGKELRIASKASNLELNSLKSSSVIRISKLEEEVYKFHIKFQSINQTVSVLQSKHLQKINELNAQNAQLQLDLNNRKVILRKLEDEWSKEKCRQESECENLKLEINNLNSQLEIVRQSHEKELNKLEANSNSLIQALRLELQHSHQTVEQLVRAKQDSDNQLSEQVDANDTLRQISDNQFNHLKNELATLSSNHKSTVSQISDENHLEKNIFIDRIAELTHARDVAVHDAAELRISLKHCNEELNFTKEQVAHLTCSLQNHKNEINDLHENLSKTRYTVIELEESLSLATKKVREFRETNTTLEERVSNYETRISSKKSSISRLIARTLELECENKNNLDKVNQLQTELDMTTQHRLDFERQKVVLNQHLQDLESELTLTRTNLSETRTELIKSEQCQHETNLRLLRTMFNREELAQRLALMESSTRVVHSSSSLRLHTCNRKQRNCLESDPPVANRERKSNSLTTTATFMTNDGNDNVNQSQVDLNCYTTVQEREHPSHQHLLMHVTEINKTTSVECPNNTPYDRITAPVSPDALQRNNTDHIISGNSPPTHARRFCRFLLDPESEDGDELLNKSFSTVSEQRHENLLNTGNDIRPGPTLNDVNQINPLRTDETNIFAERDTMSSISATLPTGHLSSNKFDPNISSHTSPQRSRSSYDVVKMPVTSMSGGTSVISTNTVSLPLCDMTNNNLSAHENKKHKIKFKKSKKRSKLPDAENGVQSNLVSSENILNKSVTSDVKIFRKSRMFNKMWKK